MCELFKDSIRKLAKSSQMPHRCQQIRHDLIFINSADVERVTSFKFLGGHITEDLTWTLNTSSLIKKAQQCGYFLRRSKRAHLSQTCRQLLLLHCGEHHNILPNSVIWQLHRCWAEGSAAGSKSCWMHHQHPVTHHQGHLTRNSVCREGTTLSSDPTHPCNGLFNPPAKWETVPVPPG